MAKVVFVLVCVAVIQIGKYNYCVFAFEIAGFKCDYFKIFSKI